MAAGLRPGACAADAPMTAPYEQAGGAALLYRLVLARPGLGALVPVVTDELKTGALASIARGRVRIRSLPILGAD